MGHAGVTRYMKLFTMMTDDEIAVYDKSTDNKNGLHRLAYEMTLLVHGKDECERAVHVVKVLVLVYCVVVAVDYFYSNVYANVIVTFSCTALSRLVSSLRR